MENKSNKTVILMGHMDVVDILDYGEQMDKAFKPLELTENLKGKDLSSAAKKDLESGDYLFGRGVSDMKAGQALQIALLQHFSEKENDFPGASCPGETSKCIISLDVSTKQNGWGDNKSNSFEFDW